jgi:hypothetical protein
VRPGVAGDAQDEPTSADTGRAWTQPGRQMPSAANAMNWVT